MIGHEDIIKINNQVDFAFQEGKKEGRIEAISEILKQINDERDNGNIAPHEFSPSICLSNVIKLCDKLK